LFQGPNIVVLKRFSDFVKLKEALEKAFVGQYSIPPLEKKVIGIFFLFFFSEE